MILDYLLKNYYEFYFIIYDKLHLVIFLIIHLLTLNHVVDQTSDYLWNVGRIIKIIFDGCGLNLLLSLWKFVQNVIFLSFSVLINKYYIFDFGKMKRNTFFYFSKLELNDMNCIKNSNAIPNATSELNIPGLKMIKDFITEAEE